MAVCHHLHLGHGAHHEESLHLGHGNHLCKAFMDQLKNPTTVKEEMQVVGEAQDNTRLYEELKALREIAVFRQQKKICRCRCGDTH